MVLSLPGGAMCIWAASALDHWPPFRITRVGIPHERRHEARHESRVTKSWRGGDAGRLTHTIREGERDERRNFACLTNGSTRRTESARSRSGGDRSDLITAIKKLQAWCAYHRSTRGTTMNKSASTETENGNFILNDDSPEA